jgi:hypothetical protein
MENNHFIPPLGSDATNLNDIEYSVDPLKFGLVGGLEFDFYPLTIGARYNLIKDSNHTNLKVDNLTGKYSQKIGHLSANTFEFSLGWRIFYSKTSKK